MSLTTPQNCTYVFSQTTFMDSLAEWQKAQIKAYPHKEDFIKTVVLGMQYYMRSAEVKEAKMIVGGDIDSFEIIMPDDLMADS